MAQNLVQIDAVSSVEMTKAALEIERTRGDQLAQAVLSNRRIGVAVGIVMVVHHLSDVAAFETLRRTSMNANRKMAEVAEDVIYLRRLPTPPRSIPASRATARPAEDQ